MRVLRRRLRELPSELQELRERHHERAHALLVALDKDYRDAERAHNERMRQAGTYEFFDLSPLTLPAGDRLKKQPDDVLVSVFVTVLTSGEYTTAGHVLGWLQRKRLPFASDDVALMLRYALGCKGKWWFLSKLGPAVSAADQLAQSSAVEPIRELLQDALKAIDGEQGDPQARTRVRGKLQELLSTGDTIDLALFDDDDWGKRMRPIVARQFGGAAGLGDLLLHFGKATASRPAAKWRKTTAERLATPGADELVRAMLEQVFETEVLVTGQWEYEGEVFYETLFLTDANATLVRGAVWSLLELERPWRFDLTRRLLDVGLRNSYKLANACIYVLGELADPDALALLARVRANVSDKSVLKQVEKALESAAERSGLTKWQLREQLVPTFGLQPDGRMEISVGEATAIVAIEPPDRVALTWRDAGGKAVRSVPSSVKESYASELRGVKNDVKELREGLSIERRRIEELFVDEASWPVAEWRDRHLVHPLTRPIAQGLIWTFVEPGGDAKVGLPLDADGLVDSDGRSFEPASGSEVRLWHPIGASVEEVAGWRSFVLERELVQPFKQAFREVYLLAPAEQETRIYSNRFAAHIVRYPQTYALMKSRGWSVVALGPYDNDGGRNSREFETAGVRVEFWLEHVPTEGDDYGPLSPLASTDQVRFYRAGEREPMPLHEVSPIIFSEAMRDVDLFVGVSSIAGDPEWRDRGDRRFDDYWYRTSFGELTESAETRRAVLEELVPRLKIGARSEVKKKFLVVRGDLRTYKIHLGSGNVLMEPNDEYLCIVPARGRGTKSVFLPFEEDSVLSVILSKAFLLADDSRIKDETIRAQIDRG
jgi:hypothetical protein